MQADMFDPRKISFGSTAAIITSMGLIVGLDAVTASTGTLLGSILIAGLADNLTDSLSVHIYQESERLPVREAFRTTTMNFIARFFVSLTFILILVALPRLPAVRLSVVWGFFLLSALSYLLARERGISAWSEIWKHDVIAVVVILLSKAIGAWILRVTGTG
jgi:VIT1/CCC1 family predicted Fe2+/Mn2+ transporter